MGSAAIRAAFEAVFANGGIPVLAQRVRKVESLASAMHNVLERVIVMTEEGPQTACVIATNVYHRTAQGWRMVAHHASPGTLQDAEDSTSGPQVLH